MNPKMFLILGVLILVGLGGYVIVSNKSGYMQPVANTNTTGYASPSVSEAMSPAPSAMSDATVNVVTDPKLGQILVGKNGMTLYMYTKDSADKSNCTGKCLDSWPPLTSNGQSTAGTGVNASLLGTADLPDGSKIVTYNHLPLYYWAKDTKAGDVTGQGVGGVWYVVSPEGKMIK